jgi:signal transduction histidine kinase
LLVGAAVLSAALEAILRPGAPERLVWAGTVVLLAPTLLWRRAMPLAMVGVGFGVSALIPVVVGGGAREAPNTYSLAFLLVLPFALVRWGSGREVVLGGAIIVGKVGLWLTLGLMGLGDVVGGFILLFAIGAAGAALRYRAGARLRQLDQVRSLERERLARDLHDTVAHHVSAIAIRAQAGLATAASRPDAAPDALRVIEAEASLALAEMRGIVRVLRQGEPADLAPGPTGSGLERLAVGPAQEGPAVDVLISGDVAGLAAPVGAALHRLAQESVTNARRHARHASRIEVRVAVDDALVRLSVTDDGDPGTSGRQRAPGFGLAGMAERAALLGGTFQAGPNAGRGWTVTAVLPRTGPSA